MKSSSIKAREGSSLAIVICVSAFLMAFALAMLYAAGLSVSRVNRRMEQERSYQLARSFSQVLEDELARYTYMKAETEPGEPALDPNLVAPNETFYRYVVEFLEGRYGEYDPDHPDETVFHFTAADVPVGVDEKAYGTIRVALYKETGEDDEDEMSGTISKDTDLTDSNTKPLNKYVFTVEVTAEVNGISFCYKTKYRQKVRYNVRYTYGAAKTPVVKVKGADGSSTWHMHSSTGPILTFEEGDEIAYEYLKGAENIRMCTFENVYKKKGDTMP